MKIYVVSVVELDEFDEENCTACWKMVKAFAREDDAKRYVKAQEHPNDYDVEDIEFLEGV